jgi:hypothetical protein
MFSKLCSILALTLTATAVAQVIRFPALVTPDPGNVLTEADFTYEGMIRIPASGVDMFTTIGAMSGRQVTGDTHLFMYSSSSGVDHPGVLELDVTGLTPNTTFASAPRATLVTDWGVIYDGKKQSWEEDLDEQNLLGVGNALPKGLLWHEANQLLYWGYSINYTDNARWSVGATSLDDDSPLTITGCGPWRFSYDNSDYDGTRHHWLLNHPTTGKMYGSGSTKSGNASISWGPSLVGGNDWPTCGTTGGIGMTPIEITHRLLNFYYPSGTYNAEGTVTGTIQQFLYQDGLTYDFEIVNSTGLRADPAQNAGVGTWADEADSSSQPIWFNGTNKKGIIYPAKLQGAFSSSFGDCGISTHAWYRNSTTGFLRTTGATGTFDSADTATGGTSKATGTVQGAVTIGANTYIFLSGISGTYTATETVTSDSGSATVAEYVNGDTCNHGCENPDATGPVSTLTTAALIIYDPAELERVRVGTIEDYEAVADSVIDVASAWPSMKLYTGTGGNHKTINGGYLTGTTLYLYAPSADDRFAPVNNEPLIHVFTIDDSAPPVPFPVLPLAAAVSVWSLGGLIGRRRAA